MERQSAKTISSLACVVVEAMSVSSLPLKNYSTRVEVLAMNEQRIGTIGYRRQIALVALLSVLTLADAFSESASTRRFRVARRNLSRLHVSSVAKEEEMIQVESEEALSANQEGEALPLEEPDTKSVWVQMNDKIGRVEDGRLMFPELFDESGQVPRMFSSLEYGKSEQGKVTATHAAGSVLGAATLVVRSTVDP